MLEIGEVEDFEMLDAGKARLAQDGEGGFGPATRARRWPRSLPSTETS